MSLYYPDNHDLEISYPQIYIQGDQIVKIYMEKMEGHTKPFVLFVQANNHMNPMIYPRETFAIIYDYLEKLEIAFQDVEIYLSDKEKSHPSLQFWNFVHYKDLYVSNILFPYPFDELPDKVRSAYNHFFRNIQEDSNRL